MSLPPKTRLIDYASMVLLLAYLNIAIAIHLEHARQWPPMVMALCLTLAFAAWHCSERLLKRICNGQPAASSPPEGRA